MYTYCDCVGLKLLDVVKDIRYVEHCCLASERNILITCRIFRHFSLIRHYSNSLCFQLLCKNLGCELSRFNRTSDEFADLNDLYCIV